MSDSADIALIVDKGHTLLYLELFFFSSGLIWHMFRSIHMNHMHCMQVLILIVLVLILRKKNIKWLLKNYKTG